MYDVISFKATSSLIVEMSNIGHIATAALNNAMMRWTLCEKVFNEENCTMLHHLSQQYGSQNYAEICLEIQVNHFNVELCLLVNEVSKLLCCCVVNFQPFLFLQYSYVIILTSHAEAKCGTLLAKYLLFHHFINSGTGGEVSP